MRVFAFSFFFVVCLLISNTCHAQKVDDLRILTESYPPFNYLENNTIVGTATEYVVEILKRSNSKLTRNDIQLVPWARAYTETLKDRNTIVYNIGRTQERESLFQWVCPVGEGQIALIGRRGISASTTEAFKGLRIGVLREDLGQQLTQDFLPEKKLDITNSIESNILKLLNGRVDLIAMELNAFNLAITTKGLSPSQFKAVHILQRLPLCIGFNEKADPKLVETFQKTLNDILEEEQSSN